MTRHERDRITREAIRHIRRNRVFPYSLRWLLLGLVIGISLKLCYLNRLMILAVE